MSLVRLCRIFHLSDLHLVAEPTARKLDDCPNPLVVALRRLFFQGCAPHDSEALRHCREAIRAELEADETWPHTLIVATGDLSTWGDPKSISAACKWLEGIEAKKWIRPSRVSIFRIYGNHDAFPGEENWFPFLATNAQIDTARSRAREVCQPQTSSMRLPTNISVEFHRINSVIHDQVLNTFAWGRVDQDSLTRLRAENGTSRCVGIAVTHHPVHDTLAAPLPRTLLDSTIAALAMPPGEKAQIRLVLSGHTHVPFPAPGSLPVDAGVALAPLLANQLQLVAGTVSQRPVRAKAPDNSFQMLRLGQRGPDELVVERTLFVRPNGIGPFVKLGNGTAVSEVAKISL